MNIERLTPQMARQKIGDLVELLEDAVDSGASIGFLPPLSREVATEYWRTIFADVATGHRLLLGAFDDKRIVGSVQLELASRANALHRAEVQRLIVATIHSAWRVDRGATFQGGATKPTGIAAGSFWARTTQPYSSHSRSRSDQPFRDAAINIFTDETKGARIAPTGATADRAGPTNKETRSSKEVSFLCLSDSANSHFWRDESLPMRFDPCSFGLIRVVVG